MFGFIKEEGSSILGMISYPALVIVLDALLIGIGLNITREIEPRIQSRIDASRGVKSPLGLIVKIMDHAHILGGIILGFYTFTKLVTEGQSYNHGLALGLSGAIFTGVFLITLVESLYFCARFVSKARRSRASTAFEHRFLPDMKCFAIIALTSIC